MAHIWTGRAGFGWLPATLMMALALGMWAPRANSESRQAVDLILHSGVVFRAGPGAVLSSAVAIAGGEIVAVGGPEIVAQFTAPRVIDLGGRLVIPGFNDAHTHMRGRPPRWISLSAAHSIEEIKELVAAKRAQLPPGAWITGYGWSEDRLAEGRKPSRFDLDAAAPENPVLLTREGGHSAVANSRALEIAGITKSSAQPEGGEFEKHPNGELTGIIRERHALVSALIPKPDPTEVAADLEQRLRAQFAQGITSLTNASTSVETFRRIWQPLYTQATGPLPRATVQIRPNLRDHTAREAIAILRDFGLKTGDGDARLKVGALKVFVDGGFTGPAAWTRRPYKNDPQYFGHAAVDLTELEALSRAAHAMGWQLGYHTIGDAAIEETVAIFVRMLADRPRPDHRHYLTHFTVMPTARTMAVMAANGIGIVQQPNFTASLEGRYKAYLSGDRLAHNNAVATPMAAGIDMAFSSDVIPIGPLYGIHAAVTRRGDSGEVFGPGEAIDVADAIRAYTAAGARKTFEENIKGRIAPGMPADVVVLSRNILTGPAAAMLDTKVDLTILGGTIVYAGN